MHGEYVPLLHDETLCMAVGMVFSYYLASLDPRDFPEWMDDMDKVWANHFSDDEASETDSDSQPEEYYDAWDY
jgi:hypothetical protein